MKTIKLKGKINRYEYLAKPVYFSQSQTFDNAKSYQFINRNVTVEYVYDIDFTVNRNISNEERLQMENALNSVFLCYGDRACDGLFAWDRMIHTYTGLINFMHDGDVSANYIAKRYVLGRGNDVGFVSDYEVFVDKTKEQVSSI